MEILLGAFVHSAYKHSVLIHFFVHDSPVFLLYHIKLGL